MAPQHVRTFRYSWGYQPSYTKRKALAAESKEMDMMGKLHLDLFFQNRYLLNGVEVRLRLIRSNDLFCLHGNANQADNKVL